MNGGSSGAAAAETALLTPSSAAVDASGYTRGSHSSQLQPVGLSLSHFRQLPFACPAFLICQASSLCDVCRDEAHWYVEAAVTPWTGQEIDGGNIWETSGGAAYEMGTAGGFIKI